MSLRCAISDGRVSHRRDSLKLAVDPDQLVFEEDLVRLDNVLVQATSAPHFYALLNKPRQTLCAPTDPRGGRDLSEWLKEMPAGSFAVGRLDRETTGALLFTTDGDLANGLLRPERHVDKVYWLWLDEPNLTEGQLAHLTDAEQQEYDAAKFARVLHKTPDYTELELTLDQGKHRQIRRMCRALGLRLIHLHRKSIGSVRTDVLKVGDVRSLEQGEVRSLWDLVGGKERLLRAKVDQLVTLARRKRAEDQPHLRLERWLDAVRA